MKSQLDSESCDIALDRIVAPLIQRTVNQSHVSAIAESYPIVGQLEDIIVAPHPSEVDMFVDVIGWNRILAARQIGLKVLRGKIVTDENAKKLLEMAIATNTLRDNGCLRDLIEQAALLLKVGGGTQEDAAKIMGVSPSLFSRWLKMQRNLDATIKAQMIPGGCVGVDDGTALAAEPSIQRRHELFDQLKANKIAKGTVRQHVARKRPARASHLRVAGASLRIPPGTTELKHASDTAYKLLGLIRAFKKTKRPDAEFTEWLNAADTTGGQDHV